MRLSPPIALGALGALAALPLLAPAAMGQGQVWVVDDNAGPGVDFPDWQAAIDAASDGDLILGREGTYPGNVVLDGKSLVLVAEPQSEIVYQPAGLLPEVGLGIRNLVPGQWVTVLGLRAESLPDAALGFFHGLGFELESNAGVVWLQGVEGLGRSGLSASGSRLVCAGGSFEGLGPGTRAGLRADDASLVAVYDATLSGSPGAGGGCSPGVSCSLGTVGGAGAFLDQGSRLYASGSSLIGGAGEPGVDIFDCQPGWGGGGGGSGGDGARLEDGASFAELLEVLLVAGTAGPTGDSLCPDGVAGQAISGAGSSSTLTGAARSVTCDSPIRAGDDSHFVFRGEPGDLVFAVSSAKPTFLFSASFLGPQLVAAPLVLNSLGTLPASGEKDFLLMTGPMPPGFDFFAFYVQSVHFTPSLEGYLGAPTALVVLDDVF